MSSVELGTIKTRVPARLDRLPWPGFHRRVWYWVRGRVDLIINGTYWLGSAAGDEQDPRRP